MIQPATPTPHTLYKNNTFPSPHLHKPSVNPYLLPFPYPLKNQIELPLPFPTMLSFPRHNPDIISGFVQCPLIPNKNLDITTFCPLMSSYIHYIYNIKHNLRKTHTMPILNPKIAPKTRIILRIVQIPYKEYITIHMGYF